MPSDTFTHDKIKLFIYENSWFKVFDKKVAYIPYFNHPDPTVKRKSGFLTPFYKAQATWDPRLAFLIFTTYQILKISLLNQEFTLRMILYFTQNIERLSKFKFEN